MTAVSVPPTQGKMEYAFELEVSGKVEDVVETLLQVSPPFGGLTCTEHRADLAGSLHVGFTFVLRQGLM